MRTKAAVAALIVLTGGVTVGCADADGAADTRSAEQLLDEADRTMRALTSVTIATDTETGLGNGRSSRLRTDLKSRCTYTSTETTGSELEQIRIGETDYIHGNEVYFEMWGRETVPAMRQKPWLKSPVNSARGADSLADCAWPYSSYGKATKGEPTEIDGKPVIAVETPNEDFGDGTDTYYIAAEGKPYLLKIVYVGSHHRATTEFSGFNEPLSIRPPAAVDVLDLSSLPQGGSD
ncbi:hypothetical protein ACFZAG_37995 [Streptomyces sp. NPDC012403]|uniref:hypothetical protein n=1 Tax=unclassified Streptomyces TaxID=2593676 RepID=UPI001C24281D|nr:hypothetical protein [Streptomyces sp. AC558_RSS880]